MQHKSNKQLEADVNKWQGNCEGKKMSIKYLQQLDEKETHILWDQNRDSNVIKNFWNFLK